MGAVFLGMLESPQRPMSPAPQSSAMNRRRRIRQSVCRPAVASIGRAPRGAFFDVYPVVDISDVGAAIQMPVLLEPGRTVDLCLDLRGVSSPVYASAQVVWSGLGRVGLSFPVVAVDSMRSLREWLQMNESPVPGGVVVATEATFSPPRPDQSELLAAVPAIQREAEAFGTDLKAALGLVASRCQSLLRASGGAIALSGSDPLLMECQASSGPSAPPVGARLQVGAGFSGACVRSGKILRCDDTDLDERVDAENCRALGIRSMLAAPVMVGTSVVGLVEVFSPQPNFFHDNDATALQKLAETVLSCLNRARVQEPIAAAAVPPLVVPTSGTVLFASLRDGQDRVVAGEGENGGAGIRLPRTYLALLVAAAATIFLALGYVSAPWIQEELHARQHSRTVAPIASARIAPTPASPGVPANLEQLRVLAEQGDAGSENALGLRYFSGDGVPRDERQAAHWFTQAAERGSLSAQSTLGSMYWAGRGVPYNVNQAYFWTVLARAGGDSTGRSLAPIIAKQLTRSQSVAIELQAEQWFQQHQGPSGARASLSN